MPDTDATRPFRSTSARDLGQDARHESMTCLEQEAVAIAEFETTHADEAWERERWGAA